MIQTLMRFVPILLGMVLTCAGAETPPLLAKAVEQWATGLEDLAFTQHTRYFTDEGKVKEERTERFDPALPDSQRWRLIDVDGRASTAEEREKWEKKKNGKARKQVAKAPAVYLDLERARQESETPTQVRFEISFRPEVSRLLAVENIAVFVTVDRESGRIARIAATLRQQIRVLLGLARITGLDLDVQLEAGDEDDPGPTGEVRTGSTARMQMSRLGTMMDYSWSDFKRVKAFEASTAPTK